VSKECPDFNGYPPRMAQRRQKCICEEHYDVTTGVGLFDRCMGILIYLRSAVDERELQAIFPFILVPYIRTRTLLCLQADDAQGKGSRRATSQRGVRPPPTNQPTNRPQSPPGSSKGRACSASFWKLSSFHLPTSVNVAMSIPGLGQIPAAPAAASTRTVALQPAWEWRFEVSAASAV
jgi:hypothetical protein